MHFIYDFFIQTTIIDQIQDHQELWVPTPPPPVTSEEAAEVYEDNNNSEPAPPTPPPVPADPERVIETSGKIQNEAQIISVEVQRHVVIEEQLEDLAVSEPIQDVPSMLVPPSSSSPQIAVEETTPVPQAVEIHDDLENEGQKNLGNHNEDEKGGKIQNDNSNDVLEKEENDASPPPQYSSTEEKEVFENSSEISGNDSVENGGKIQNSNDTKEEEMEESMEFSDENENITEPETSAEEEPIPEIEQTPILLPPMEVGQ